MVGSWTDWELTDLGRIQAENIASRLAEELNGKKVKLYSSDLRRALQTARAVSAELDTEVSIREELRERNLGKCCGRSVQWLRENLECEEKTIDDRLFSDAESRRDVWNRLEPFFDEIMNGDSEYVVIVSHGDLLSVFNAMFLGMEPGSLMEYSIHGAAGGVSVMTVDDGGKRTVKKIGDMSYI